MLYSSKGYCFHSPKVVNSPKFSTIQQLKGQRAGYEAMQASVFSCIINMLAMLCHDRSVKQIPYSELFLRGKFSQIELFSAFQGENFHELLSIHEISKNFPPQK